MMSVKRCDTAGRTPLAENKLIRFLLVALALALIGIAYRFRIPLESTLPLTLPPNHTLTQLYPTKTGYIAVTISPSGDYFIQTEKQTRGPLRSLGVTSDSLVLTHPLPSPSTLNLRWMGGSVFACKQKEKWYVKEGRRLIGPYLKVKWVALDTDRAQVFAAVTGPSGDYRLVDRKTKGPYPEVLPLFVQGPDQRDVAFVTRQGKRYFVRTNKAIKGPFDSVRDIRWSATGYDFAVLAKDDGQWWVVSDWGRFGPLPPSTHALQVWPQKSKLSFATLEAGRYTTHLWYNRVPYIGSIITDPHGFPAGSVYYNPHTHRVVKMR